MKSQAHHPTQHFKTTQTQSQKPKSPPECPSATLGRDSGTSKPRKSHQKTAKSSPRKAKASTHSERPLPGKNLTQVALPGADPSKTSPPTLPDVPGSNQQIISPRSQPGNYPSSSHLSKQLLTILRHNPAGSHHRHTAQQTNTFVTFTARPTRPCINR